MSRFSLFKRTLILATGLLALSMTASAFADLISYDIGVPNSALTAYPAPYATMSIDRTSSTTASVTFNALSTAAYDYLLGGQNVVDLNVNGSFNVSGVSESNSFSGFSPQPSGYPQLSSGNVSTFGTFNLSLKNFDGFQHSATSVSFLLTNTSGTWSSAGDVLTPNGSSYMAAAHIFVCAGPCSITGGAVITGYGANGGGSVPVPAPPIVPLAVFGLTIIGWMYRRHRMG